MDAGFVLALPFHHGDLESDCVGASKRGAYAWDENTSARPWAKNAGGAYARGGPICGTLWYKSKNLSLTLCTWKLCTRHLFITQKLTLSV